MRYLKQFGIILIISFLSEILHELIPLPIPASIYGIVILFLCLEIRLFNVSSIKETSSFLIEIMPLLFIPAAVELIESWSILRPALFAYVTITIVSTIAVMVISGRITQLLIKRKKNKEKSYE